MKILLTGRSGQVGSALERALAPLGNLTAVDRAGMDLLDAHAIRAKVKELKPAIIVNAAAYTAVDRAETEREAVFAVNAAAGILAEEARKIDALLIHFSTDYVFDGEKRTPYIESDAPAPLNVYGASKLVSERLVAASGCRHFIFRASWVYGPASRNFLRAILAAADSKPELRVVDDQHGAPTSSAALAVALAHILARPDLLQRPSGIYHLSAAGETTWYGFAKEILELKGPKARVTPISSAEYGAPARRPGNSMLDNTKARNTFGFGLDHWRDVLAAVMRTMH